MGEAKLRAEEIDATKKRAEQDQQAVAQLAHFTADPAVYVNGMFATIAEDTVRVTFHETQHQMLPPKLRASLAMSAQTCENVGNFMVRIAADAKRLTAERVARDAAKAKEEADQAAYDENEFGPDTPPASPPAAA
jgi:hypothetical protein